MSKIIFNGNNGDFSLENPECYNSLYFPIAGEKGIKSALSTTFGGDSKIDQNSFILEPTSIENLNNNRSSRNFWLCFENNKIYSVTGQSAEAEMCRNTDEMDESELTAGFMWQRLSRKSKKYGVSSEVISFALNDYNTEVMVVSVQNEGIDEITFRGVAAIPVYGRSADNLRDHRHVTSLLHNIRTTQNGVYVRPRLSFDERGHKKNDLTYYVCGHMGNGSNPEGFYPTAEEFIGHSGSFSWPYALTAGKPAVGCNVVIDGKEALGGISFEKVSLKKGESVSFIIYLGATENETEINAVRDKIGNIEKAQSELETIKVYWQELVNIGYHTGNPDFDNYMKWVTFQPFLRRIYGCSFLPHHDYGRGGRGWRDLWQDCLALLLMNPDGVRKMILDNFKGVRVDGTNATIIGNKPGEFKADRNNIPRVWMDHGFWPLMTVDLYINQTGDFDILNQKATYFKDDFICRGNRKDTAGANANNDNELLTRDGQIYEGTVLEHLLVQNLCAVYEVGEHGHLRLRGADWNDALDMATHKGESVAFTCAYAGNLRTLAAYVRKLNTSIEVLKEAEILFTNTKNANENIENKTEILGTYCDKCAEGIMGEKVSLDCIAVADALEAKADYIMKHVREDEFVDDGEGNTWINSYYDDNARQVEGKLDGNVRMMLTGQVFALMSHTADEKLAKSIAKSAKKYLFVPGKGGYRINTDFGEEKYDMGRMFGFAYGEKENGAVFSHMAVMYANALYKNGFNREAYEVLKELADTSLDFDTSVMLPGIPEYFNAEGRGLYSYLTGAASWYMMTVLTENFGINGQMGNLLIAPKLLKEQFDNNNTAGINFVFAGKKVSVLFENNNQKDLGEYRISGAVVGTDKENEAKTDMVQITDDGGVLVSRENIVSLPGQNVFIKVILE